MPKSLLLLLLALPLSIALVSSQTPRSEDEEAVHGAIQDYISAFYDRKPELIVRSVHPDVAKFGFFRPSEEADYREAPIAFEALVDLAGSLNQSGWIPADAARDVTLYEVLDKTAAARCSAAWGIDFLHLAKYDDGWKIVQVLWQSHPSPSKEASQD